MSQQRAAIQRRPVTDLLSTAAVALGVVLYAWLPFPWIAIGPLVGLIGITLRPWLAIPAVVLVLPYHLHPRSLGGLELSLNEIMLLTGVVGVSLRGLAERQGCWSRVPKAVLMPSPSPADLGAALFLAAGLTSLLVTEYPKQSLREIRWLIVEPIGLFYLARATLATSSMAAATLWAIVLAGVCAGLVSIGGLAASGSLADPGVRGTEPFLSPNHLGLFLGRAASVALALVLFGPPRSLGLIPLRPAAAASFTVIAVGIMRSISLGAWAGLAAVCLALSALRSRALVLTACVAIGLVAGGVVIVLPPERIQARFDPEIGTGQSRIRVWDASVRMISDHPLLGIGLDNFLYKYRTEYLSPEAWREPNLSHPHNWVLNFWLSLGLLGLAAACGLMAWAAKTAHDIFHRPSDVSDRALGAAVGGMLVAFLVHGSLDNSYFLVDAATLWWLSLALLCARGVYAQQPTVLQSSESAPGPALAPTHVQAFPAEPP